MRALNTISISRAGAMAAVVASRRLRRMLPFTAKAGLTIGGSAIIGIGAGATLATGLGPGPFDVLITGVADQTGLPFAYSLWLLAGSLTVVAALLGDRPGLGTIGAPLIIGPVVGWSSEAIRTALALTIETGGGANGLVAVWQQRPTEVVGAVAIHLLGICLIGIGAGALITSGLGAGTADLLTAATSSRLGRSAPLVRTGLELSFVVFGLLLGGQIGLGTMLVALTIGPAVRSGHANVEAAVAAALGVAVEARKGTAGLQLAIRSVGFRRPSP